MRNNRRNRSIIIWLVLIMVVAIYVFNYIDKNIKPSLIAFSEVKAKAIATQSINESVKAKLTDDINYNDLIFVKYDSNGKVTLMQANTILMNNIASDVALEVQEQMRKLSEAIIKIPISNAFNTQLISLPSIRLHIIPQGTVTVDFATEFEESGINQTRHRIYLIINTDVRIIVPLVSETIRVTANIPIAETIIVGDVPEQYINVPKENILQVVD